VTHKSQGSKYKSISQALITIVKEEGLISLWKGHLTGQLLSTSYIVVQFGSFELLTKYAFKVSPQLLHSDQSKTLTHFVCGGLAAVMASLVNQPIDVLKTRLITQGEPRMYNGLADACIKILRHEGVRGFYKGVTPSLMLVAPQSAVTFSVYELMNMSWRKLGIDPDKSANHVNAFQSAFNGAVAGVVAKSIVYPMDVVKRRLQIQGFEQARVSFGKVVKFDGVIDCIVKTVTSEGLMGIYKGYLPSMIKSGLSTATIFLCYEQTIKLMRYLKEKEAKNLDPNK